MGRTSVVIVEAISMSDKIIVLSKRPASVKSVHEINLVTEGEKTPLKTRKVPQFQYYFDILWKELDSYEIKQYLLRRICQLP